MNCGFGRLPAAKAVKRVFIRLFINEEEDAGVYAAKAAVRYCSGINQWYRYDLDADIQAMREIRKTPD